MRPVAVLEEIDGLVTVELPDGLIGLPGARRFSLARWGGEDSPFALLRAVDVEGLELVVVPPALFFPAYAPVIDDDLAADLDLHVADDAVLLVIVTVAEPVADSTANLLGPIVVNRRTRRAAQAVLSADEHGTRVPLVAVHAR